jgi:hypothetical protein
MKHSIVSGFSFFCVQGWSLLALVHPECGSVQKCVHEMSPLFFYSLKKKQLNKWILIWSTTCADIYQSGNKSIQILFFSRVLFWIYLIRKFGSPPSYFYRFAMFYDRPVKKNKIAASCNIRHFHRMSQPAKSIVKLVVDSRSNFALSLSWVCAVLPVASFY